VSAFLFFAAVAGGALNAVAGGGSFIALPALLYAGISPVAANATTTMALWPGSVSSAVAYRREIRLTGARLVVLSAVSVAGGLIGAILLVRTSDTSFMRLLPWLMLAAAVTFTFGGRKATEAQRHGDQIATETQRHGDQHVQDPFLGGPVPLWQNPSVPLWRSKLAIVAGMQFAIAIYGGYFGGGMGIMMLATLAMAGMTDIHEMNGLKAILGAAINGVALVEFIASGSIAWTPGFLMAAGGTIGGYAGAAGARHIARAHIRMFVVATAWAMTMYFFVR
jgi:uncharacterized protein